MKKLLPIALLLLGVILMYIYFDTRLPEGVQAKGGEDWGATVALASSVVSIIGSVITAVLQVLQHRRG